MTLWTIADAFGIYHHIDCQHSERIARTPSGWQCNGCGQHSPTTTKETNE